jgi:hypothetical protein
MLGRIALRVQRDGRSLKVEVRPDGDGLVSHAGAALLAEAAERLGLTRWLSWALERICQRRGKHDPGRVVRDLAVMLADGGYCLADLRAVRDQEPLFGEVASDSTAFRLIDQIAGDIELLDALRAARARARENAWRAGAKPERIVIDVDATLIGAHSASSGDPIRRSRARWLSVPVGSRSSGLSRSMAAWAAVAAEPSRLRCREPRSARRRRRSSQAAARGRRAR